MEGIFDWLTKPTEVWHLLILLTYIGFLIRGVERRLDNIWRQLSEVRRHLDPRQDD